MFFLLIGATACSPAGANELMVHEYDCLKLSGLRESTKTTLLNQGVTAEHIRDEPEFVLMTNDFSLIGDFIEMIRLDREPVACPLQEDLLWVADLMSDGEITTYSGGSGFVATPDGTCRTVDGLSISRLLK
jgi:hypothetical protein